MTIALSSRTIKLVELFFKVEDQELIKDILINEGGNNIPFCENTTPERSERIRFSIIKISGGDLGLFDEALAQAKRDWRDLFFEAGFGKPGEHIDWYNKIIGP